MDRPSFAFLVRPKESAGMSPRRRDKGARAISMHRYLLPRLPHLGGASQRHRGRASPSIIRRTSGLFILRFARHWVVLGRTSQVESPTSNFAFLSAHDAQLVKLGTMAERYFDDDPLAAIFKLRQFSELLSKTIAAHHALLEERETFERTPHRLCYEHHPKRDREPLPWAREGEQRDNPRK
jgi:hypothetical protein